MAIVRKMTPAERVAHGLSMSEAILQVAIYRLELSNPSSTKREAQRLALEEIYRRKPGTYLPR